MRIITGTARGCRLKTPKGEATRPTADRIKESLFNILGVSKRRACSISSLGRVLWDSRP